MAEWVSGTEIKKQVKNPNEYYNSMIYCSNCKHEAYWDTDYGQQRFDFCPYCGADMRGDAD